VPADGRARYVIDALASYVVADGCAFEQAVMSANSGNPEFGFLFDLRSPEHAYYRWGTHFQSVDLSREQHASPACLVAVASLCC
jgi:U2-associated protein SR140